MKFEVCLYGIKYYIELVNENLSEYRLHTTNESINNALKMDKNVFIDIMEKNNGEIIFSDSPVFLYYSSSRFLFKSEEDAEKAIEELEPYLIMIKLMS